jgi:small subunit ribosomal protein S9
MMKSNNNANNSHKPGRKPSNQFPNPKLRAHAVSVLDGDYSDHFTMDMGGDGDDYDEDFENGEPVFDKFSDDKWDIKNYDSAQNAQANVEDDTEKWERELATEAYEKKKEKDAKKAKWLANAKPKVRVSEVDAAGQSYGKGGRKVASARVWIRPGEGVVTINRRDFLDYFPRDTHREMILGPFIATKTCGMFDMTVQVEGGGLSGKAGAVRHGLARALEKYYPDFRPPMKRLGFMTRDSRVVERKKIGLKKARKAPQWVRR